MPTCSRCNVVKVDTSHHLQHKYSSSSCSSKRFFIAVLKHVNYTTCTDIKTVFLEYVIRTGKMMVEQ